MRDLKQLRDVMLPPRIFMRDILPDAKKLLGLSKKRSPDRFLDSEWWYDYPRKMLTDEYLERHRQWWARVSPFVEGQIKETDTLYTRIFECENGYKSRVYFRKPPY